jgi:Cytochrome P460
LRRIIPHVPPAKLGGRIVKWLTVLVLAIAIGLTVFAGLPLVPGHADEEASPIYGIKLPAGYRDWRLIAVAREEGKNNDIRAILGNDIAIKAAREQKLPYPDGAIIARIAWSFDPLPESAHAFGQPQTHVAGTPKEGVQFMVKDSNKYASTAGWGFAEFDDGKPAAEAVQKNCFGCHEIGKARDFVFNHYAR